MSGSRRDFLKNSGFAVMAGTGYLSSSQWLAGADDPASDFMKRLENSGSAAPTAPGAAAPGSTGFKDKRLESPTIVTIFLRGGADSLNAIVPAGDDLYYKWRPRIAIPVKPKNGLAALKIDKKIGMDGYWGLNPGFKSLLPLIEAGVAAPILNVGSPNGTRSHFSAQDYMERGAPGDARVTNGWLNRYLQATRKQTDAPLRGLCAMTLLPRALRGEYPVLAGANRTEEMELFEDLYAGDNLVGQTAREGAMGERGSRLDDMPTDAVKKRQLTSDWARDIISDSGTNAVIRIKALEAAMGSPVEANYPSGGLGHQLRTIAQVIKANVGLEVAQADFGGWDTHSDQGDVEGRYTNMLKHVSDSIAAFHKDLGPRMNKVIVLVMSEFGRTVKENGAQGTDHGRGGFMLAVSNSLNGGKFYGTWKGMQDMMGDYQPVHTDYRSVFMESVIKLFNVDLPKATAIFPGYKPTQKDMLDFVKFQPKPA